MDEIYYEDEIRALNKSRIKYLVVGGIAVNLYGLFRFTRDLDLMIDISEENLLKFVRLMEELNYATNVSVEELKEKKLIALCFRHKKDEFKQIDIFLKNPISFKQAYKRRKVLRLGKINISCVSLKDLIKMKEIAGRDRDWIDIGYLKKFSQGNLK